MRERVQTLRIVSICLNEKFIWSMGEVLLILSLFVFYKGRVFIQGALFLFSALFGSETQ